MLILTAVDSLTSILLLMSPEVELRRQPFGQEFDVTSGFAGNVASLTLLQLGAFDNNNAAWGHNVTVSIDVLNGSTLAQLLRV